MFEKIIDEITECLYSLSVWLGIGVIAFIGGMDVDIKALLCLTIIDCITGFMKAVKEGNVLSKSMFKGFVLRKPAIYLAIASMHQLDTTSIMSDIDFSLRACMISGCLLMEAISIGENLIELGVKFPGVIEKIFAIKKDKLDGK